MAPPAEPAIALADIKQFLRIEADVTEFDAQLAGFAATAVGHIEGLCGIRMAQQQVLLLADAWADLASLPIGPVTQIESIVWRDGADVEQTLDAGDYELAGAGLATGIRPSVGSAWPSGLRDVAGAIAVTVTAGYDVLPPPLWAAALYLTGDLFAFRETAVVGTVAAKIPMSAPVEAMLANYRIWL